jgi:tRNA(Arg) A34 adenosine deaminase TadA
MCQAAMKWVGIKKVVYSTNTGFKEMKLWANELLLLTD